MKRTHAPKWPFMDALLAQGGVKPTQPRLAEVSFVPTRTISKIIGQAKPSGLLVGGRGTHFGPGMGMTLAVSMGTASLRAALVDCNGTLHCKREAQRDPAQLLAAPRSLLPRIRAIAADVLEAGLDADELRVAGGDSLSLLGLSVAWPSPLDRSKRVRGRALRDGTWKTRDAKNRKSTPLPERLATDFGGPFSLDRCHSLNDVSASTLGVAFRQSRGRALEDDGDDQWRVGLVIRVGGSLGAGTIVMAPHCSKRLSFIDSSLIEGTNGFAGELGHLPIGRTFVEELNETCEVDGLADIDYDGSRCSCGRPHHLEGLASGAALLKRLEASGYDVPSGREGIAAAFAEIASGEPDERMAHALTDIGRILGRALTGPILMLDPYSITITGSLAGKHLVEGMRRERDKWANAIDDSVEIGHLTKDDPSYITVQGAGLAVIRRLVYRNFLDRRAKSPDTFEFGPEDLVALRARD